MLGEKSSNDLSSVGTLLCNAAANLGRASKHVSLYEARLEEDWFNKPEHLKNRSAECLSKYMPLRLAEEVKRLVEEECSE